MTLNEFFKENPKTALAFSGGVDSSYLLYAARQTGAEVHAYYVKTAFQPEFEYEDAMGLAKQLGTQVTVLRLNALSGRPPRGGQPCQPLLLLQAEYLWEYLAGGPGRWLHRSAGWHQCL